MPSIRISYDESSLERNVEKLLKRKLDKALSSETKMEIAGEYASAVAKYVPYRSGKLLNSARVVMDGDQPAIRYSARSKKGYDYADYQYNTPIPQESRTTPGTYDHWNRHLTTAERKAFYEEAGRIVTREMNNG